ncbi:hypothetical protein BaRGS_00015911 [Batillaria attramentaria]|uniref:Uncharacterized protein n=1 Tax=Batillaria attramentaria TaxID=370345 RepID=A0ABD0KZU1_9CAEN
MGARAIREVTAVPTETAQHRGGFVVIDNARVATLRRHVFSALLGSAALTCVTSIQLNCTYILLDVLADTATSF